MNRITLVGAGKIGEAILHLLQSTGDYAVTVIDRDELAIGRLCAAGVDARVEDVADVSRLSRQLRGQHAVISAAPFFLTPRIAAAASAAGVHYFDLTEDVASTREVRALASASSTAFMPQCGLAPGFISIAANDLAQRFEALRSIRMRVGALPLYPSNALRYNLTWSTDGLINEYCNPCEAIVDGRLAEMPPLEEIEHLSIDGIDYEAFNTSGGLGSLCETYAGRVETLNYKTVRYPGHRDIIKLLMHDLRLAQRRDLLKDVLEAAVPVTQQDVVLVFVTATGWQGGRLAQETWARKIYSNEWHGRHFSAIQLTTAAGVCAAVDLLLDGQLPQRGYVRQEQVALNTFLGNRFGSIYAATPAVADGPAALTSSAGRDLALH